ncbi:MAG: hypothetical protein ACTSWN_14055 [Promethearchaeota archaeon]
MRTSTKNELLTPDLMFSERGQNLKRQGVAQILNVIPFVHFFGNAWLFWVERSLFYKIAEKH